MNRVPLMEKDRISPDLKSMRGGDDNHSSIYSEIENQD